MTRAKSEVRIKYFEKPITYSIFPHSNITIYSYFNLRLSPEQSGKVEYERERLLGIANKLTTLIEIAVIS
jgi:hypothetical protein